LLLEVFCTRQRKKVMGIQSQFVTKNARKTMFSALFIILLKYFRTLALFLLSLFM
jgi:hypothetical protein